MRLSRYVALVGCGLLTASCTSYSSSVLDMAQPARDGIVYFMPSRLIRITISVDKDGKQTPTVDQTDTIPDLAQAYTLYYEKSLVGKNHLSVEVTPTGLLTSSAADTVSGVITIAKNLAQFAGQLTVLEGALPQAQPKPTNTSSCLPNQSYTELLRHGLDKPHPLCSFDITITLLGPTFLKSSRIAEKPASSLSGIFYRQNLPYKVVLIDKANSQSEYLAFSPDQSPTYFMPITRTFFANNNSTLKFSTPGVLTSIDQSSDGELVAASELPSDIISAYFGAIGSLFTEVDPIGWTEIGAT